MAVVDANANKDDIFTTAMGPTLLVASGLCPPPRFRPDMGLHYRPASWLPAFNYSESFDGAIAFLLTLCMLPPQIWIGAGWKNRREVVLTLTLVDVTQDDHLIVVRGVLIAGQPGIGKTVLGDLLGEKAEGKGEGGIV